MSSILKALQKLEQEKTSRVTREPDIHAGITRKIRTRQPERPKWLLPASMLAVAVLSIAVTYTLMKWGNRTPAPVEKGIPAESRVQEMPPAPARNVETVQIPAPQLPAARKPPAKTQVKALQPTPALPKATGDSAPFPTEQPQQAKVDTPAAKQTPQAHPAITINGIAWQKDSASRMAVINGTPVSEGGIVQGAKVERIFQDRVRFLHNGRLFEVPFGKGEHQ